MADQIKITGTIVALPEPQQVTEKMTKRLLVLKTDGQYPETIAVEFINDKIDLLANLRLGQSATAYVNIRGREWQSKYFVSLNGWKVEAGVGGEPAAQPRTAAQATAAPITSDDDNDLPF